MAKYKFQDRAWNVTHKNGKHLGVASVTADSMREAMDDHKGTLSPETIEDELLQNSVGGILWNHKVDPEDVEVTEIQNEPRRGSRKSYGDY